MVRGDLCWQYLNRRRWGGVQDFGETCWPDTWMLRYCNIWIIFCRNMFFFFFPNIFCKLTLISLESCQRVNFLVGQFCDFDCSPYSTKPKQLDLSAQNQPKFSARRICDSNFQSCQPTNSLFGNYETIFGISKGIAVSGNQADESHLQLNPTSTHLVGLSGLLVAYFSCIFIYFQHLEYK